MGRLFVEYLEDERGPKFVCAQCECDVACYSSLIWEGFMGAQQPAYLFRATVNLEPCSSHRQEALSSGTYTLVDVSCRCCAQQLGWQYIQACNEEQKYKEGGVLLAQATVQRTFPHLPGNAASALQLLADGHLPPGVHC